MLLRRCGQSFLVVAALGTTAVACGRHGLGQAKPEAGVNVDQAVLDTTMVVPPSLDVGAPEVSAVADLAAHPDATVDLGVASLCGNGVLDPGEACDDGNRISGDGCSARCCMEGCWACTRGCLVAGRRPCGCGDGVLDDDEACDDGNLIPGDGCNQYCERESATCGNGSLEDGEECDDGNRKGGDGCDAACLYDPPESVCRINFASCGDRRRTGSESCDDGNVFDGDGCSSTCSIEPGWDCPSSGGRCSSTLARRMGD